jgi:hypothetical protein
MSQVTPSVIPIVIDNNHRNFVVFSRTLSDQVDDWRWILDEFSDEKLHVINS